MRTMAWAQCDMSTQLKAVADTRSALYILVIAFLLLAPNTAFPCCSGPRQSTQHQDSQQYDSMQIVSAAASLSDKTLNITFSLCNLGRSVVSIRISSIALNYEIDSGLCLEGSDPGGTTEIELMPIVSHVIRDKMHTIPRFDSAQCALVYPLSDMRFTMQLDIDIPGLSTEKTDSIGIWLPYLVVSRGDELPEYTHGSVSLEYQFEFVANDRQACKKAILGLTHTAGNSMKATVLRLWDNETQNRIWTTVPVSRVPQRQDAK